MKHTNEELLEEENTNSCLVPVTQIYQTPLEKTTIVKYDVNFYNGIILSFHDETVIV